MVLGVPAADKTVPMELSIVAIDKHLLVVLKMQADVLVRAAWPGV